MNKLYIVMYHYVRPIIDSDFPNVKGLELKLFEQQLDYFIKNFSVVTMEEVIDSITGSYNLPPNPILLTFDDGYIDHYKYVFPLLKKKHIQGSFYVPSNIIKNRIVLDVNKIHFILACSTIDRIIKDIYNELDICRSRGFHIKPTDEIYKELAIPNRWDSGEVIFVKRLLQTYLPEELRSNIVGKLFVKYIGVSEKQFSDDLYVNMNQIKEMKNEGMHFGLHGDKHVWLNNLSQNEMEEDIKESLEFYKDVIDSKYLTINYPYGGYNEEVLKYARDIGCKLGFSVEGRCVDIDRDNPLIYPRYDTNDFPPKSNKWNKC